MGSTAAPFPASSSSATFSFRGEAIGVRVEPMLRIQGYPDLDRVRPRVREVAAAVAKLTERSIHPEVRFRRLPVVARDDERLTLPGGVRLESGVFSHFLAKCDQIIVFVMTLGSELDRATQAAQERDELLEALFLETAGWLSIETLTKQFSDHLREQLDREGLRLTRRLSPGYRFPVGERFLEWPLADQKPLFELFAAQPLPVEVLESCAMLPKMSRSGLYGLRVKGDA